MSERLFLFIGGLSSKAFAMLVTGLSAFFSVAIGEVMTDHVAYAALAGAIGTGLTASILVVPRIMEQRRKSRESAALLQSGLLSKMTDLHRSEVDFYKLQLASERLIITIERNAKHKAISEWGAAVNHYQILAAQLRANKLTPDIILTVKTYADILGDSDKEIKQVNAARVAEIPPTLPAST
jgi:hypothetical protein